MATLRGRLSLRSPRNEDLSAAELAGRQAGRNFLRIKISTSLNLLLKLEYSTMKKWFNLFTYTVLLSQKTFDVFRKENWKLNLRADKLYIYLEEKQNILEDFGVGLFRSNQIVFISINLHIIGNYFFNRTSIEVFYISSLKKENKYWKMRTLAVYCSALWIK